MFRKAVCMLLAVFSLGTNIAYGATIKTISGESVTDVAAPVIETESAIIVDIKTGQQLYGKNIYEKHYPASITKIMTCTLALEKLDLEDTVTFSAEAVNLAIGSSAAYVVEGEQISVKDCLYGLMVHSCNDLANGLAEAVSGDMDSFAKLMTSKAKELGCTGTNFVNAHGLDDENHYTCAYDMALIAKYAFDTQPLYREIIKTQKYDIGPTNKCEESRYWNNGNELILEGSYFYYEDCIGGKTGYDEKAKSTLVTYANINGRELLCVLLKAPSKSQAMEETKLLYEFIKANVSMDYYEQIDKVYKEEQEIESKKAAEEASKEAKKQSEKAAEANASVANKNKASNEKKGMPVWAKVIITIIVVLVVLFVGFYAYLRYALYVRRKRRREMRRRRQMQQRRRMEQQKRMERASEE